MDFKIELMSELTAEKYAVINTQSWIESYKGIIDEEFLDKIGTGEEINKMTDNLIKNIHDNSKRFLLKVNGDYVGLFRIRKTKYDGFDGYGELGTLYLLTRAKGHGYGKIMFEYAKNELKKQGYNKMIIGCLDGNPSNEFYLHMGCDFIKTNPIKIGEQNLIENIYTINI